MASVATARADVVIESYVSKRPEDAERILGPVKAAFERHGATAKPGLILEVDAAYLPLDGNADREITRAKLVERVERAAGRAEKEGYGEAAALLEAVFRDIDNNPAVVASDTEARVWLSKARAALSLSYLRTKRADQAANVIADHIRSYPDMPLPSEAEDVVKLYEARMAALGGTPRGKLVFRVNRPEAEIFVNEVKRGAGTADVSLLSGDYRVVVGVGGVYRRYRVSVRSGGTTERTVDWSVDGAFSVANGWLGFVAPLSAQRGVAAFLQRLAQQNPADAVIVLGVVDHNGRRYVTAKRYDATAASRRSGRAVALEGDTRAAIDALATYMTTPDAAGAAVSASSAPALLLVRDDGERIVPIIAGESIGPARWPAAVATAVFAVAVPTGAYLLKKGQLDCYNDCSTVEAAAGIGALSVGAAALGFGIYWIWHSDKASHAILDVHPVPGGGVASVVGRF